MDERNENERKGAINYEAVNDDAVFFEFSVNKVCMFTTDMQEWNVEFSGGKGVRCH